LTNITYHSMSQSRLIHSLVIAFTWSYSECRFCFAIKVVGQVIWCLAHTIWIGNYVAIAASFASISHHLFVIWNSLWFYFTTKIKNNICMKLMVCSINVNQFWSVTIFLRSNLTFNKRSYNRDKLVFLL